MVDLIAGPSRPAAINDGLPENSLTMDYAGQSSYNLSGDEMNVPQRIGAFTALTAADLAATTAASLGLVDDDALAVTLKEHMPKMSAFYQDNKGAIQLTSTVAGTLLPAWGGIKAIQGGGKLAQIMGRVPGASKIFINSQEQARRTRALSRLNITASKAGVEGDALKTMLAPAKSALNKSNWARSFKESLAAETAIYATQNANEMLFPDEWEWYDYAPFMGGAFLADAGIGKLMLRKQARVIAARSKAKYSQQFENPQNMPMSKLIGGRDAQDEVITQRVLYRMSLEDAQVQNIDPAGYEQVAASNRNRTIQETNGEIRRDIQGLAAKTVPELSQAYNIGNPETDMLMAMLEQNPMSMMGVRHIVPYEHTPSKRLALVDDIQKRVDALDAQRKLAIKNKQGKRAENLRKEMEDVASWQPIVVRNGQQIPLEDDFTRFADTYDARKRINTHRGKGAEPTVYSIDDVVDPSTHKPVTMSMTDDFHIDLGPDPQATVTYQRRDGDAFFAQKALKEANEQGDLSRETVVYMSPKQYLKLANEIDPRSSTADKTKLVKGVLKSGGRFNELPSLKLTKHGTTGSQVFGHNGRHRAKELAERGVKSMPVKVIALDELGIRWGQTDKRPAYVFAQEGATNPDFNMKLPEIQTFKGPKKTSRPFEERIRSQSTFDTSAMFALYSHGIDVFNPERTLAIARSNHWTRKEAIVNGLERGKVKERNLTFEQGYDIDDMRADVVKGKKADWEYFTKRNEQEFSPSGVTLQGIPKTSTTEMRMRLNMPGTAHGELSPLEMYFYANKGADLPHSNPTMIADDIAKHQTTYEGYEWARTDVKMAGEELNIRYDRATGQYEKPVTLLKTDLKPAALTRDAMEEGLMFRQMEVLVGLTKGRGFVTELSKAMKESPAYAEARKVQNITEGASTGDAIVVQGRFSQRDQSTFQALNDIATLKEKIRIKYVEDLYDMDLLHHTDGVKTGRTLSQQFSELRNVNNLGDMAELGAYHQARHRGWVVKQAPVLRGEKWAFVLDPANAHNKETFRRMYGKEMPAEALMPRFTASGEYVPLEIGEMAMGGAQAFRQLSQVMLREQNKILRSLGQPVVRPREWWVPPKNFANKHVAYVVSPTDNKIINMLGGRSAGDLDRQIKSGMVQDVIKNTGGQIRYQDEVRSFYDARNRMFFEMADAGDFIISREKALKGSSQGIAESARETVDNAVRSISQQVGNLADDTARLMFEPQLEYARRMHNITAGEAVRGKKASGTRSVYEQYQDVLYGRQGIRRDTRMGAAYQYVEHFYDDTMEKLWDLTQQRGVGGSLKLKAKKGLAKLGGPDLIQKEFEQVSTTLGEYAPFRNAQEFIETNLGAKPPASMREHMAALNWFTSSMILRWFEIAHPLLNMAGVVTTMPAIMTALKRRPGEAVPEWQGRIGAFGSHIPSEGGFEYGFFDAAKMLPTAVHFAFSARGRQVYEQASNLGYIRQEVAEIHRTISDPMGSASRAKAIGQNADKWIDILSTRSEDASRAWGHIAGYLIGEQNGIRSGRNLHTFAHRFANEVIGDYRASNRPQMFQGAAGMPLGLFQTYMFNYYQRLFSYIEAGDVRATAVQFAMQASIFGATTVPGYRAFSSMWESAYDGRTTPVDALQKNYNKDIADALLYGTISNIPKIFADDGVAFYSRGDTTPRVAVLDPKQIPIASMVRSVWNSVGAVADQVRSGGEGVSGQQTLEAIGVHMTNRPMKGLLELASGYALDQRGNVVTDDVYSGISIAARIVGLRPLAEAKAREAEWRLRMTDTSQYAKRARTRNALKSAFRGGNVDTQLVIDALMDYIGQGGAPEHFAQFLKQAYVQAVTPGAKVKLLEALRSSKSDGLHDAIRLMNAGVGDGFSEPFQP